MKATCVGYWQAIIAVLGVGLFSACGGDADFAGSARQSANVVETPEDFEPPQGGPEEPPPVTEVELTPFASLTWHWQCDSAPGVIPEPETENDVVVAGVGPHSFHQGELLGTPMTISGELCPPEALARDIVFVIDTSGSMSNPNEGNDQQIGGTCGRLRAIQNVIDSVPAGLATFSIVTFNDDADPMSNSTQLWATGDQMVADLERNGQSYADVICAAGGNTNYTDGLVKARSLLETGDPAATKEVYFVSDGQPNFGQDGVLEASQMRYPGVNIGAEFKPVTIATVMMGGIDTVLESRIASKVDDGNGNMVPLHAFVANTQQLAEALSDLSSNAITDGILKYRPIGSQIWIELSLLDHLNGYEFSVDAGDIDWADAPDGIEVYYSYRDAHGNEFGSGGELVWMEEDQKAMTVTDTDADNTL